MLAENPLELAKWQFDRDRSRPEHVPGLFQRKIARMAASPLAFLRGSAPLFYRLLAEESSLREGPDGTGWLSGDAHLENFGAYRTDRKRDDASGEREKDPVIFGVNDFDEAVVAPFRYDVLRLVTSLILGSRELRTGGKRTLDLCRRLLDGHRAALASDGSPPPRPRIVERLLEKVDRRSQKDLLEARTEGSHGRRHFSLGERYASLSAEVRASAIDGFHTYAKGFNPSFIDPLRLEIEDLAFRIAGTGSLGCLRIAVLTRGKGGDDGEFVFDMKEETEPAAAPLVSEPSPEPVERVLTAMKACLPHPPRMLGSAVVSGRPMLVRRLAPQEDKLDLTKVDPDDLPALASHLGALLGCTHRHGGTALPSAPWSDAELDGIVERAIALAGIHESAYLAFCKLA